MKKKMNKNSKNHNSEEGASLLYVIFFITLLSVFACGFMAISQYHIRSALKNRAYMEARLTTRMIHRSFCQAVSSGESDAFRLLWNQYEEDRFLLEEELENAEEDGEEEPEALDTDNEEEATDLEESIAQELSEKEYITEGEGTYLDQKGTRCKVRIRLKIYPVQEMAVVDTWTDISGFTMHLDGEIPLEDTP